MPAEARVGLAVAVLCVSLSCVAGDTAPEAPPLAPPPSGPGAMAPFLVADGDDLLLSWLEPDADGAGHRLVAARLRRDAWSEPAVIAEGEKFFANWADVPKIAVAGDGTLWAHWLAKTGDDTYAYGIFLARSDDGGASWAPAGTLHVDTTPTEHGFVAYAAEGDGVRAVWLDGREMVDGGAMTLRTALLSDGVGPEEVLDSRVCECCPAELVATPSGAVAFYRDRSAEEIRNIGVVRLRDGAWTAPEPLHDDGWRIPGCPVNGPAADAEDGLLGVAWFTAAEERPVVQVAFSRDDGASFTAPLVLDGDRPLGRVDLVRGAGESAWVSWLSVAGEKAELRLAQVAPAGVVESRVVATTGASRASGIPRLARVDGELYGAWVETVDGRPATLRVERLLGS